MSHLKLGVE